MNIRLLPWVLAIAGLALPLVGSGLALWAPIAGWVAALVAFWVLGRSIESTRTQRLRLGVVLLPILFLAAFEGGWWLIPADLAWIAVEWAHREEPETSADVTA
jgi:peptidoglycan biosynthesis protein MviN/MurJ (putative lipid II flippase)